MDTTKPKLGSTEETNRLLGGNYFDTADGSQIKPFSPTEAITAESLGGNAQPIILPESKVSTTADRIAGGTNALLELDKLKQQAAQETAERQAKLKESENTRKGLLEKIGLVKSSVTGLEEDAGIPQLSETARKASDALLVSQRQQTNELRALEGAGLTDIQRAAQVRAVNRKYGFEQADLQLSYHLANSDLNAAKTIINDKVALSLEPLYEQLDLQKDVYNQISQSLSKSEDREWGLAISKTENAIAEQKALEKYKGDIAITASQNGTPLPSYVQQELSRATTQAEVNEVLASNGVSLAKPVISTTTSGNPVVNPDTGKTLDYGTPEYIEQALLNTSGSKTKPVASERENLGKFQRVIYQVSDLAKTLNKTSTDPILGKLKEFNPYSFDARSVNAQINALVPNVARGVYGEVGVLTDTDIARYLQTLPNITSTKQQNDFVTALTLKNAQRAFEIDLLNMANSGVNVSGYVDTYKNITQQIKTLEDSLGIGQVKQVDDIGAEDAFDSVVSPETYQSSSWLVNTWNSLFK